VRGSRSNGGSGEGIAGVQFSPMTQPKLLRLVEIGGEIHVGPPKTDEGNRTVSLPPFLRDMLTEHLARFSDPAEPGAFVFTMPEGGSTPARELPPTLLRSRGGGGGTHVAADAPQSPRHGGDSCPDGRRRRDGGRAGAVLLNRVRFQQIGGGAIARGGGKA
jgi:hypothetical protein